MSVSEHSGADVAAVDVGAPASVDQEVMLSFPISNGKLASLGEEYKAVLHDSVRRMCNSGLRVVQFENAEGKVQHMTWMQPSMKGYDNVMMHLKLAAVIIGNGHVRMYANSQLSLTARCLTKAPKPPQRKRKASTATAAAAAAAQAHASAAPHAEECDDDSMRRPLKRVTTEEDSVLDPAEQAARDIHERLRAVAHVTKDPADDTFAQRLTAIRDNIAGFVAGKNPAPHIGKKVTAIVQRAEALAAKELPLPDAPTAAAAAH
jgi:hypothetical protein